MKYPWNILVLFTRRDIVRLRDICGCGKGNNHFKVLQMPIHGGDTMIIQCVSCKNERTCSIEDMVEIKTKEGPKYERIPGTKRFKKSAPDIMDMRLPGSYGSRNG